MEVMLLFQGPPGSDGTPGIPGLPGVKGAHVSTGQHSHMDSGVTAETKPNQSVSPGK